MMSASDRSYTFTNHSLGISLRAAIRYAGPTLTKPAGALSENIQVMPRHDLSAVSLSDLVQ